MNCSPAIHRYQLYGLQVASQVELPELVAGPFEGDPDVRIELGRPYLAASACQDEQPGRIPLIVEGVAAYTMERGRVIRVNPAENANPAEVRLFLLGSAFAAILHQRGLLPLHSNVLEFEGKAVAFLGHSGAGKSTLAAWFHDQGHRVLSDDVCVVTLCAGRAPIAFAGVPRLRLWSDALKASGRLGEEDARVASDIDKFVVRTSDSGDVGPAELSHLYLMEEQSEASPEALVVNRMSGAEAVQTLIENTYRGSYVGSLGTVRQNMEQCVAIASRVPIFKLSRPWSLDRLDEVGQALAAHIRSVRASSSG